jgi:two-component system chemotaxis response regulator CheY
MRVLIVDDSRAMRKIERDVVSGLGEVDVIEAEDGVHAIERLEEVGFRVDLILLDWMMPRMDGIELLRLIKDYESLRRIPVLMVTSSCDEHRMREVWEIGVDGYLLKPFTRELFLQAISSLGSRFARDGDLARNVSHELPESRSRMGFFEELPEELRRRFVDFSFIVDHDPGEVVLDAGIVPTSFYYVAAGHIDEQPAGTPQDAGYSRSYGVGECFAATELIARDALRYTYRASARTKTGRLPHAAFESLILHYPPIGRALSRVLASKAREISVRGSNPWQGAGIAVGLEALDLPSLVQAIHLRQQTCTIVVPELAAELSFRSGSLVSATCGPTCGRDAFFRILSADPKDLRLSKRFSERPRDVFESPMSLLLEISNHEARESARETSRLIEQGARGMRRERAEA